MNILGFPVAQSERQVELLDINIERFGVTLFVELGVYRGGLANYMMLKQTGTFRYVGVELFDTIDEPIKHRPEIIKDDCVSNKVVQQISDIIQKTVGTVLVFCDNGHKELEMETYSRIIRPGDLIQVHDYPGECSPQFLERFGKTHPNFEEIDKEEFRNNGTTLWKRQT